MCCSDSDFIQCYPLFGIGLPVINVEIMELEVSWLDNSTELVSELPEARDMASTRCIAAARCAMCFIIFSSALHLRCMMLLSIVLNAIPQI
jgi:hypothetical protein